MTVFDISSDLPDSLMLSNSNDFTRIAPEVDHRLLVKLNCIFWTLFLLSVSFVDHVKVESVLYLTSCFIVSLEADILVLLSRLGRRP